MNKLDEARSGGIGVPQQIGYGKNWHTEYPEPITWENIMKVLEKLNPINFFKYFTYNARKERLKELSKTTFKSSVV